MKILFLTIGAKKNEWLEIVTERYLKKIGHFFPTSYDDIKSKPLARQQKTARIRLEMDQLLERLNARDFVIALDEKGEVQRGSIEFSRRLENVLSQGHARIVIVVGGAYGLGPEVLKRANWIVSFSKLTFSHQLALAIALEQVYRAFTILKNIPYHNAD